VRGVWQLGGDEGLESQDLQQPKVRKKHCQQVQKSGDDHADPVTDSRVKDLFENRTDMQESIPTSHPLIETDLFLFFLFCQLS